ncbi:MAG: epoxyqueuosine reductase, partial [Syntrophobacteraceae bacterium]
IKAGLNLMAGTRPKNIMAEAISIIVVLASYFDRSFPPYMEKHFGRCYLDDDRVTKDGLALKIKTFRNFLHDHSLRTKAPFNLPHRLAAARAGLGNFGKNCLFYPHRAVYRGSWVLPIAILTDQEFTPAKPTLEVGCPDWCKNACMVTCPTGALKGPRKIDPRRCISFLTYFGRGLTPMELREPMGLWVYGCDNCQNVCPRNRAWLAKSLEPNPKVFKIMEDFNLARLLHMDRTYFETRINPHMFYMRYEDIWRWKMNVARAMGNTLDPSYVPELIRAFEDNPDERVRSMAAWSLGRIGGKRARAGLEKFNLHSQGTVKEEVRMALKKLE